MEAVEDIAADNCKVALLPVAEPQDRTCACILASLVAALCVCLQGC